MCWVRSIESGPFLFLFLSLVPCSTYERKLRAIPSELPRRALASEVRKEKKRGERVAILYWISIKANVCKTSDPWLDQSSESVLEFCRQSYMSAYICIYIYAYVSAYVSAYISAYIYLYIYLHTYHNIYISYHIIYICIYICLWNKSYPWFLLGKLCRPRRGRDSW